MSSLSIETRELRSFRLYQRTSDMRSFLNKKDTFGVFMMCNALQPKDRENLRELLLPLKLKIQYIPNKVARFVFAKKTKDDTFLSEQQNWIAINNLLEGNVILITDENGGLIEEDRLTFLLQQPLFFVRFVFVNGYIYRQRDLRALLNIPLQQRQLGKKLIPSLLTSLIYRNLLLLLALKTKSDKDKNNKK